MFFLQQLDSDDRPNLVSEAVQQQVQAADRSLDSLVRFLCRQPAEGSAAGAPGEHPPLQEETKKKHLHGLMNTKQRAQK